MQFIGQEENLKIINTWKYLPNFIIIQGDAHTGKTYLTLQICKLFKLHYVEIGNTAKEVRNLIDVMKLNSNTLYHFKNFETASLEAKNALLKITEEPIPGNYIVITGGPQIKTLQSRARIILMAPYSEADMCQYMEPIYPNPKLQLRLIHAGINTPAKVYYYKEYAHIESLLNFAYEVFNKITYLSPEYIISMLSRFEDKYDEGIDACMLFLIMLINIIEDNIKTKGYYSYEPILNILLMGKKLLSKEDTLRRKMLLFRIFYNIYELGVIQNEKP